MAKDRTDLTQKLVKLSKRGWVLKPYEMWGSDKPCPSRLVVNPYDGCDFRHKYCYIPACAKPKAGFRSHLLKRIGEAKKLKLEDTPVILSSSTDPFQPIERSQRDSLFALESLLSNGFPVLIMTRNPQMLLEKEYEEITKNPKLYLDVSIPSMHENNKESFFYSSIAPRLSETFAAIKELSDLDKYIRVKIEPVTPSLSGIIGQSQEELDEIVKNSKTAGAKKIISKTLRLTPDIPKSIYDKLISYYEENGVQEMNTIALRSDIRKHLLAPVFEACQSYDIPFCPCVDSDVFTEQTSSCLLNKR